MNDGATSLPPGFSELEGFVRDWAVAGSNARKDRRIASNREERLSFYQTAAPFLRPALAYLDQFPLGSLDPEQTRLLDMMLMLGHIALAVEKQGDDEERHAINHAHFIITRSTEDA